MLSIPRPQIESLDIFRRCAAAQSLRLGALLPEVSPVIEQEYEAYQAAMGAEGVVEFPRSDRVGDFEKNDFLSLYSDQLGPVDV